MPLKPLFKLKNESIWSIFGERCVEKPTLRPSWNATIESGFCHHCLLRHNCPSNVLFSHHRGYRELQTAHQKSPGSSAAPRATRSRRHQLLSAQLGQQNMWRVLSVVVRGATSCYHVPGQLCLQLSPLFSLGQDSGQEGSDGAGGRDHRQGAVLRVGSLSAPRGPRPSL